MLKRRLKKNELKRNKRLLLKPKRKELEPSKKFELKNSFKWQHCGKWKIKTM